jgi:hypothetical protein
MPKSGKKIHIHQAQGARRVYLDRINRIIRTKKNQKAIWTQINTDKHSLSQSRRDPQRNHVGSKPAPEAEASKPSPFDSTPFDLAQGLRQGHERRRMASSLLLLSLPVPRAVALGLLRSPFEPELIVSKKRSELTDLNPRSLEFITDTCESRSSCLVSYLKLEIQAERGSRGEASPLLLLGGVVSHISSGDPCPSVFICVQKDSLRFSVPRSSLGERA